MEDIEFDKLNHLLKAPSKEFILRLCDEAFSVRMMRRFPDAVVSQVTQAMSLQSDVEAVQLLTALCSLVKNVIFRGSSEPSDIASLFPGDFNKNLAALLTKIMIQRLPLWKQDASNSLSMMPRLIDFDWRVDIKTSSDNLARMSVPTCILQMQIQEPVTKSNVVPTASCVNVELSRQTLDTMLDGLGRIRDQLSSVATAK